MKGVHIKGDSPLSLRLGEGVEFWIRTYATENDLSIGQAVRVAIKEFAISHANDCSATLD